MKKLRKETVTNAINYSFTFDKSRHSTLKNVLSGLYFLLHYCKKK